LYKIEKREFGLWLTFGGVISGEEMARWLNDFSRELTSVSSSFCVFVDMRNVAPFGKKGQVHVQDGQKLAKRCGMVRSVVILDNPVTTMQFKHIAMDTGIYEWERYIDSSKDKNWEQIGMDWLEKSIDPDKKEKAKASV
jgi:hypothetical protein